MEFIAREARSLRRGVLRASPTNAHSIAGGLSMIERAAENALAAGEETEERECVQRRVHPSERRRQFALAGVSGS